MSFNHTRCNLGKSLDKAMSWAWMCDSATAPCGLTDNCTAGGFDGLYKHFLAERVSTYHGDGCSSDRRADRRSWDDAAQRRAHVYRQQEAFAHRLDVLRTQLQQ